MVLTMQRLSLRTQLEKNSCLTATHDANNAWSGLGAATLGVVSQIRLPSSPTSVVTIFIYLLGIAVLHVTSPALLTISTSDGDPVDVNVTTRGILDYTAPSMTSMTAGMFGIDATPTLHRMNSSRPGLQNQYVYEVADSTGEQRGYATLRALEFNVTCQEPTGFSAVLNHTQLILPGIATQISGSGQVVLPYHTRLFLTLGRSI
jgi:hypothetical protein